LAGAGRPGRPRRDARRARVPPRSGLRAPRGQARLPRGGDRACEGGRVIAPRELIVAAGTPAARRRLERLGARGAETGARVERAVLRIIRAVRRDGDRALLALTRRYDGVALRPGTLRVPADDLAAAYRAQPAAVRRDLELAARRIRAFHTRQRERSW